MSGREPYVAGSVATLEMQVRERLNLPAWQAARWELLGDLKGDHTHQVSRLDGGVYPPISKGKNQGEPNWRRPEPGTKQTFYITPLEHSTWLLGWERRTGSCSKCFKHPGQEFQSWNHLTGTQYRTCTRCQGTGKAPTQEGGDA